MFSGKKLLSFIGAAGLIMGVAACGGSGGVGGTITIACVDGTVTLCANGSVIYSLVTPAGVTVPPSSGPVDYTEVVNALACGELGLFYDDIDECGDPGLEDEDGGVCSVTISDNPDYVNETSAYYSLDGSVDITADGSHDFFLDECDDLDNTEELTEVDPYEIATECDDCSDD